MKLNYLLCWPFCKIFLSIFTGLLLVCCDKHADDLDYDPIAEHTLLIIMEANNDLREFALRNINEMELGLSGVDKASNVLIYLRANNEDAVLLKLKYDRDLNRIAADTVKQYVLSHSSVNHLRNVVNDTRMMFEAQSYGLILWSHATSWAPVSNQMQGKMAFGNDRGREMDIVDLAAALPDGFKYLIFDACNMASLEVLWEFKEKAEFIIASPTEVLVDGFPYQVILPKLLRKDPLLEVVADDYYQYYANRNGLMQSATVSLIDTKELAQLAPLSRVVYQQNKGTKSLSRQGVQRLDFSTGFPVATFDFGDYLAKNFSDVDLFDIQKQLQKLVLYSNATGRFMGSPIAAFSGLSCFIPEEDDAQLGYYRRLKWFSESGMNLYY